jgi:hypothetical protein
MAETMQPGDDRSERPGWSRDRHENRFEIPAGFSIEILIDLKDAAPEYDGARPEWITL